MIVLSFNVKEKVKDFYLDLLIETIEQRPRPELQNNNYFFKSKYTNELYDIFIPLCRSRAQLQKNWNNNGCFIFKNT